MPHPITILLVDDHPAIREGLAARIAQCDDMTICAEAEGALQALKAVKDTLPDIVITDIGLKDGNGLDLVKQLKAQNKKLRILVLSMHPDNLYAEPALRAGAHGYICKTESTEIVVEAVREVMAGRTYVSAETRERLLQRTIGEQMKMGAESEEKLTDREKQVYQLIGQGPSLWKSQPS
jgi:DNA-binding NarL/FixJ family response regulator